MSQVCSSCTTENPDGHRFCGQCGASLAQACGACGAPLPPGQRFCGQCGTAVTATPLPGSLAAAPRSAVAERRIVSVLFADLVGFTTLAEHRDPEEVRELLGRYFDTARRIITRYGGTVEKFIGDAVMAVWGTPSAREDDAERAVRAALDLCDAVTAFGAETRLPELRLRAGVVTGEAAINVGAEGQGMVAGDVVNTASRIQAVAGPGSVLVDGGTRRAAAAAIVWEDAGEHLLKGRSEVTHLWRPTRVVAMVRGAQRGPGLEAPFTGRDHELRLLKSLFHSTVDEGRARLVDIVGVAGIGKSRLAWEFEKYIDGIADIVWWHRGRCLSYGDGVTYWALAEMVRSRAGILEGDRPDVARTKLSEALTRYVDDADDRRWLEPRLAHLLDLEALATPDRVDLFAAWRLFFERLATQAPAVLVFEDLQWADSGLIEFVEYLLEWSRHHPIFVVTLARPEVAERHPSFGSSLRSRHTMHLERLPDAAMDELLRGLAPGLPDDLRARVRERADGVPLYAVETVRTLLDRGALRREGDVLVVVAPVDDLDVPESLHALIAARIDNLTPRERSVVHDAAVMGQSFSRERLHAVTGIPHGELGALLDALVRKEVFAVEADPRSPERGQYAFVQALVQRVAYDTLSRHDRKARHLAVARRLEEEWGDTDEAVEVIASHYVEAYAAAPDEPDAGPIRDKAHAMLVRAGERAASLAAANEASRYFLRSAELVDAPVPRAELLERAGAMAARAGRREDALRHLGDALATFEREGMTHPAARVTARLGELEWNTGDMDAAVARMEAAFSILRDEEWDADLGTLAAQLGRLHALGTAPASALPYLDIALEIAEENELTELLAQALTTRAVVLRTGGRWHEANALHQYALALALDHDLFEAAARAHNNLGAVNSWVGDYEGALGHADAALALARRRGDRVVEAFYLSNVLTSLLVMGRWDDLLKRSNEAGDLVHSGRALARMSAAQCVSSIHARRGEVAAAREVLAAVEDLASANDPHVAASLAATTACILQAEGRGAEARAEAEAAITLALEAISEDSLLEALRVALDVMLAEGDDDAARALVERVEASRVWRRHAMIEAMLLAARGRLALRRRDDAEGDRLLRGAAAALRRCGALFDLASVLLDHGAWLVALGREEGEAMLTEALTIFRGLGAAPSVERAVAAMGGGTALVS